MASPWAQLTGGVLLFACALGMIALKLHVFFIGMAFVQSAYRIALGVVRLPQNRGRYTTLPDTIALVGVVIWIAATFASFASAR